jgi:hypothetical protein
VCAAVALDLRYGLTNIVPSVVLELGAGVLLFALLFWAERRLIVRGQQQTAALIEALTGSDVDPAMADRYSVTGPIVVADTFWRAAIKGDYVTAWDHADDNWRLCRAQAWLWNNRDHFGDDLETLGDLAECLVRDRESCPVWENFVHVERQQFIDEWGDINPDEFGAGSTRRVVAPGYEIVRFIPLGEFRRGFIVHEPHIVLRGFQFLVHLTDDGWRVSSFAEAAPVPGWPPSWWLQDDPAAIAATDAMLDSS